jgi:hypothetical protein
MFTLELPALVGGIANAKRKRRPDGVTPLIATASGQSVDTLCPYFRSQKDGRLKQRGG